MEPQSGNTPIMLPIDWSSERDITPRYANHAFIKNENDLFTLLFYDLHQPLVLGTPEEIKAQLLDVKFIKPECVAKIYLSPKIVEAFLSALQENYNNFMKKQNHDESGDQSC